MLLELGNIIYLMDFNVNLKHLGRKLESASETESSSEILHGASVTSSFSP